MHNLINKRTLVLLLFIALIVSTRVLAALLPDLQFLGSLSGIGAVAIFSGSYFKNKLNRFVLPMMVLLVSDFVLGLTVHSSYFFYQGWYYTYIAFGLMILAGKLLVKQPSATSVFGASLVGVFIHWIVADFGVWYGSAFYPQTLAGFWACLVAAIPFEFRFLCGTLLYSAIMFTAFEALKTKFAVLNAAYVKA